MPLAGAKEDAVLSQTVREFGGAFSKSSRFGSLKATAPGPKYDVDAALSKEAIVGHTQAPRMVPRLVQNPKTTYSNDIWKGHSNPYAERGGYLVGSNRETTGEKAVYIEHAEHLGPAAYNTYDKSEKLTKVNSNRPVFAKSKRFMAVDKLTVTKELCEMQKGMGSPGPHLYPPKGLIDFTKHSSESHVFGSGSQKDGGRHSMQRHFLNTRVQGEFIYPCVPASGTMVSPNNYAPKPERIENTAPRPILGKADRFKPTMLLAPYTKKDEVPLMGLRSPGPAKYSGQTGLEVEHNGKHRASAAGADKWCP